MADDPQFPEMPADADPMALLAFMQRLMGALQRGEDPTELLADAPPGFQELFLEAQQRMQSGDLPDLESLGGLDALGGFDSLGFVVDDEDEEAGRADAEESSHENGQARPDDERPRNDEA
jgi:hypothetical protein